MEPCHRGQGQGGDARGLNGVAVAVSGGNGIGGPGVKVEIEREDGGGCHEEQLSRLQMQSLLQ